MKQVISKIIYFIFIIYISCTNYSSNPLAINPVVLLAPPSGNSSTTKINAIERTATGHILRVAAQNVEFTFKGYRIYQASTEEAVLSLPPTTGIDCGFLIELPNTSKIYIMEVSTNPQGLATLCTFPTTLVSGSYVSIRTTYFSGFGMEDGVSLPSNALIVP